jgi:hypothetical protein
MLRLWSGSTAFSPTIRSTAANQGAQFTSDEFTKMLRDHRIEISVDGAAIGLEGAGVPHLGLGEHRADEPLEHDP